MLAGNRRSLAALHTNHGQLLFQHLKYELSSSAMPILMPWQRSAASVSERRQW
jgi:hypothetical protein